MVKSEVKLQKLYDMVSRNNKFVLYGAGDIADVLVEILKEKNYQPLYCVVTQQNFDKKTVQGIPVFCINEKLEELKAEKIFVIVSVIAHRHENEIVNILNSYGITNVALMTELSFPFNAVTYNKLYCGKDYRWYVPRIEEWYVQQYASDLDITLLYQQKADKNRIVFVVENFSPRVVKFAEALKGCGKTLIVLLSERTRGQVYKKFYNALERCNVSIQFFGPIEELIFLLLKNKGGIIHLFSNAAFLYTSAVLIRLQSVIGTIVLDCYDILNGFYRNVEKERLEIEKYCIENAGGICYRESNIDVLRDGLHFNIKGRTIRFYDYCFSEEFDLLNEKGNEELSICYAGGVDTEEEWPGFPFACFMELASLCEKNQCHLHVYTAIWDEKKYELYIRKSKESRYFHFHRPVAYDKLIKELSQYDYGICPVSNNVYKKEKNGYITEEKYRCLGTNKYFDCLDAGLPMITAALQEISKYLEQKGVLLNWTNGQYDFDYLREKKGIMRKNVAAVKEEMKIGNHIWELLEFYDKVQD